MKEFAQNLLRKVFLDSQDSGVGIWHDLPDSHFYFTRFISIVID